MDRKSNPMKWCLTALIFLSAVAVLAQDVVIRRSTTTTTTTTSTTTVSKPQDHVVKPPKKPTTGTLTVTSTPSGAAVKIGGKYMGETPLTLEKQKPDTYSVTVSAEGYESQTRSVSVTAGKTATCSVTLKKKQVQQPVVQQPKPPVQQPPVTSTTTSSATQTFTANGVSFKMILVEGQGVPFYIGETEVTQELWQAVMGGNPSRFKGANRPVEIVSWNDCKEFISKLNAITHKVFRLPKESEWEYAAKGGNKSHGYEYSGSNSLEEVGWYYENSGDARLDDSNWDVSNLDKNNCRTHDVKTKKANELGIYDMSGNVWEWCEDLYDSSGSDRVYRGGSWSGNAWNCRVSFRNDFTPDYRVNSLGLRLAL